LKTKRGNSSSAKLVQIDSDSESTGNIADAALLVCYMILKSS
jgi:hypothetical protein